MSLRERGDLQNAYKSCRLLCERFPEFSARVIHFSGLMSENQRAVLFSDCTPFTTERGHDIYARIFHYQTRTRNWINFHNLPINL